MAIHDGRMILTAAAILLVALASRCPAQAARTAAAPAERSSTWRPPSERATPPADRPAASSERAAPTTAPARPGDTAANVDPIEPLKPITEDLRRSIAKVTHGIETLPNEHGQVWRTYDISPYTLRVTSTSHPEQAIVDWVLRETGTDTWFTGSVAVLNADRDTLRVYHTPETQRLVANVVDRFVVSQADTYSLGLKLSTVGSPNWRTKYHTLLRPVTVQSPGVDA